MVPVGVAQIQPDADPAVAEIGRAVIAVFVAVDQHRLFFRAADFHQKRGFAVAMVVDRNISEFLAADDAEAGHAMGGYLVCFGLRHRAFADLRDQPFGIFIARHIGGQDARVELVFGYFNSLRERFGGVVGAD